MHETTLVGDSTVAADQDVVCNGLPEHFDLQHVGDDLFRFTIDVWVYKRDVVIAGNDISER